MKTHLKVPGEGVEPSRARQRDLKPSCLPFHHPGRVDTELRKTSKPQLCVLFKRTKGGVSNGLLVASFSSGSRIRTCALQDMSLTGYLAAPFRK